MAKKMIKKRSFISLWIGIIGGAFIVISGFAIANFGGNVLPLTVDMFGVINNAPITPNTGLFVPIGLFGMLSGIIIIISAVMLNKTNNRTLSSFWSTLIIFFAALSLVNAAGGFLIGFFLALFGGIMGLGRE